MSTGTALASPLLEFDWRTLAASIIQGDCILMLGPDAVTKGIDGNDVPVMQLFGRYLRERLQGTVELPDDCHVNQAAQEFKKKFDATDLQLAADEFFQQDASPDEVLLNLAALPFRLVISTTPGTEMEDAFEKNGKNPTCEWYNFKGPGKEMVHEGTEKNPLVYHLYGCIRDMKSLVLAEDDLLDFLVKVISKDPALPNNIGSAFASKESRFLFLGFGLKQWHLRILLHVRYASGNKARSFALEKFDTSTDRISIERTKSFFQDGHRIHFFEMGIPEFAAELRRRVEERRRAQTSERASAPKADAPKVFLCHASEDKEYAADLTKKLQAQGIEPWLDKNELEGGVQWDTEIERSIKSADYVIVMQSRALIEKKKGYVNKEIELALKQQQFFRDLKYIVPVLIDDCEPLENLSHLQTIDLKAAGGFEQVLKTIRRDHELRKKR